MKQNQIISLVITVIICVVIAVVFVYLVYVIFKQRNQIISNGLDDEKIVKQYEKEHANKKNKTIIKVLTITLDAVLLIVFGGLFATSIYVQAFNNNNAISGVSIPRVVMSGSMSEKNEANTYLFENNLNNQFQTYDVVFLDKLPDEFELKQYDIVMYEVENTLIIHRIINIEEPNENHPEHRYFQLKGDANASADKFPVKYEQMKGIYNNKNIKFVGMFIAFFQSPLGYLTIIVIVAYVFGLPFIEKKMNQVVENRLKEINYTYIPKETKEEASQPAVEEKAVEPKPIKKTKKTKEENNE